MRIPQYPLVHELENATLILIDGPTGGTKTIQAKDLASELSKMAGATRSYEDLDEWITLEDRRNTFRGKNLGNTYTTEQKAKVADGTFKGFFIGDYWEKDNIKYRIADINYWLGTGDTECTTPHLVIVPDSGLGAPQKMNDTAINTGGYLGSKMVAEYMGNAVQQPILNIFPSQSLLTHRELLINSVSNGYQSGAIFVGRIWDLMNEPMVYGAYHYVPSPTGTVLSYRGTIDKTQLALFQLHPEYIISRNASGEREQYWLRDAYFSTSFCFSDKYGRSGTSNAASALAVRPVFGIIG